MFRLLPIMLLILFSCAKKSSEVTNSTPPQKIEVEFPDIQLIIDGANEGEFVALVGSFLGENYLVDSARVQVDGLIHFKREIPYQQGLVFALLEDDTAIEMLITEDQTFKFKTQKNDINGQMKTEGTLENQLFYETRQFESKLQKEIKYIQTQLSKNQGDKALLEGQLYSAIDERFDYLENLKKKYPHSFFLTYKTSAQSTDMRDYERQAEKLPIKEYEYIFRNGFWDNVNFNDDRLLSTPVISNKLEKYFNYLVPQEADSIIRYGNALIDKSEFHPAFFQFLTNWMLLNFDPLKSSLMDAEAVYVNVVENYISKEKAFWVDSMKVYAFQQKAYAMSMSLLNQQGQDIVGYDVEGNELSIYGQTSDYVALYVFNPKCGLCKEETPRLVENYNRLKTLGVEVLAVATDTDADELKKYIKESGIKFPVIHDENNYLMYPKYYVNRTPELYLLNPERKIIGKNLRADLVETVIEFSQKES